MGHGLWHVSFVSFSFKVSLGTSTLTNDRSANQTALVPVLVLGTAAVELWCCGAVVAGDNIGSSITDGPMLEYWSSQFICSISHLSGLNHTLCDCFPISNFYSFSFAGFPA